MKNLEKMQGERKGEKGGMPMAKEGRWWGKKALPNSFSS